MPAGLNNNYSVIPTPTLVYSPASATTSNVTISNAGEWGVFYGQSNVSLFSGTLLAPNQRVHLRNQTSPTYVSGPVSNGTAAATLGTGGIATVGTTKLTVTTMNTSYAAGTTLVLGSSTNTEIVTVASTATTVVTLSNPTLLYHPVGDVMTAATAQIGQVTVIAGAGIPWGVQTYGG